MDQLNGMFKLTFRMNLLFMWVAFCLTACSQARASSDYYPDIPPEDYFIEQQLARFLREQQDQLQQQQQQELLLQQQQRRPNPDFSFKFPDRLPSSAFAVSPADPRYYNDPHSLPGADVDEEEGAGLYPRQSDDDMEIEEPDKLQTETPTISTRQQNQEVQVAPVTASPDDYSDIYFISIVAGASAAAALGVIGLGISWYRLQKNAKAAADVEYPAYGVTGPNKEVSPTGDRRLAQSAQMYHYQHQKQQIIAMESSRVTNERNGSLSDAESEEENEEGDYTVYECPGLASTGEMEVKNPLFQDDPTPATPATMATTPASSGQPVVASQTSPESKK